MEKQQRAWMINLISVLLIIGVFILASLALVNVGIGAYKNIVLTTNDNFQLRTSLSYVATKVRQSDTLNSISIEEKDGVNVLILGEEIDGAIYETLIYHYQGHLCELYREQGMDYDLSYGIPVMEIDQFNIKLMDDGYLWIEAQNKDSEAEELILYPRTGS